MTNTIHFPTGMKMTQTKNSKREGLQDRLSRLAIHITYMLSGPPVVKTNIAMLSTTSCQRVTSAELMHQENR